MGEAPQAICLVEDVDDVDRLEVEDETKLAYLTQTTLSVDDGSTTPADAHAGRSRSAATGLRRPVWKSGITEAA